MEYYDSSYKGIFEHFWYQEQCHFRYNISDRRNFAEQFFYEGIKACKNIATEFINDKNSDWNSKDLFEDFYQNLKLEANKKVRISDSLRRSFELGYKTFKSKLDNHLEEMK